MFAPSSVPQGDSGNNTETVVKNMVLFNCMRRSCVVLNKTLRKTTQKWICVGGLRGIMLHMLGAHLPTNADETD